MIVPLAVDADPTSNELASDNTPEVPRISPFTSSVLAGEVVNIPTLWLSPSQWIEVLGVAKVACEWMIWKSG